MSHELPQTENKTGAPVKTVAPVMKNRLILSFCWKGSQSEYKMGRFSERFIKLMVDEIVAVCQSESSGYVCITVFYR